MSCCKPIPPPTERGRLKRPSRRGWSFTRKLLQRTVLPQWRASSATRCRERRMPARIVLVHDDADVVEGAAAAIRAAGYDVAAFHGSLAALDALGGAQT